MIHHLAPSLATAVRQAGRQEEVLVVKFSMLNNSIAGYHNSF